MWIQVFKFYDENSKEIGEVELENFDKTVNEAVYFLIESELKAVKAALLNFFKGTVNKNGEPILLEEDIENLDDLSEVFYNFEEELRGKLFEETKYNEFDIRMKTEKKITPRELFKIAEKNGLLDSPIKMTFYSDPEEENTKRVPLLEGSVYIEDDFIELAL